MNFWRNIPGHEYEFLPGEEVPDSGEYRCSTCTNQQFFEKGRKFSECRICKGMVRSWCHKNKKDNTGGNPPEES